MSGKNLKVALQVKADLDQARREIGSLKDTIQDTAKAADTVTASQGKTSKAIAITADEVKKLSGATNLKDGIKQVSDYENWLSRTSVASKHVADSNGLIEKSITSLTPHLTALIGLSGGFIAVAVDTLNKAVELQNLSNLSGANVEHFQYYAAGAKKVGIEQNKLGDIFKDTRDKVGDFIATGGGEMADFFENIAPKVGVTAEQFKKLSGPEALQLFYDSLQKAGVSQNEMVFYMESIADEGSALIPLLADGGAGFKKYGDAAKEAGAILSQDTVNNAKKAKEAMGDFQMGVEGVTNKLIANAAPAIVFVAENLDVLVRAGLLVATVFAGRMISSTAATTIAFIAGRIEAIKYQMALANMAGVATTTAARLTALSTVSRLLTVAGGLPGLAIAAAGVAASFLLMPSSSDAATESLDQQHKSVAELAEEYRKLDETQQRITMRDAVKQVDDLSEAYRKQYLALAGVVRAVMNNSEVSQKDKEIVKQLYDEYVKGDITANQLATSLSKLGTVNRELKSRVDEQAKSATDAKNALDKQNLVIDVYSGKVSAAALASDNLSGSFDGVGASADSAATKIGNLGKAYQEYMAKLNSGTLDNLMIAGMMQSGLSDQEARMRQELLNAKNSDPNAKQTYGALTDEEIAKIKIRISSEEGVTAEKEKQKKQEEATTKEKEKQAKLALTQKAIAAASNEQTRKMLMVYQALSKTGLPDNAARYFTAEIGREGSFLDKNLFGSHKDANNGYTNTGMISWQKSRSKELMAFLKSQGVIDDKGQIKQTQEALDAQAEFLVNELFTNKAYSKSKNALLSGKGYKDLQQTVGNNYIGWDIAANTLSQSAVNKNISRMDGYKNQLDSLLGTDPAAVLSDFSKISKIREDFVKAQEQQEQSRITIDLRFATEPEKLKKEYDDLVKQINDAGYDSETLKTRLEQAEQEYQDKLSKRPEILKRVQESMPALDESWLRASGEGLEADLKAVEEKWKQSKADIASLMMSESDPLQANRYQNMLVKIDFVIDQEKLTLQYNNAVERFKQLDELRNARLDNLKTQFDSGQITQPQYAEQAKQINELLRPEMEKMVELAWQYADAMQGVAGERARANTLAIQQTMVETNNEFKKFLPTAEQLNDRIASGLTDAFMDFADGTKSASEAFHEFASSFLREIAQMILKQMIFNAISSIGGKGGGGVGGMIASGLSAAFGSFMDGGHTGYGARDQIAGFVHADEWVITKPRTNEPGAKQFLAYFEKYGMQGLNNFKGYSTGGLVGAPEISMPPNIQPPQLTNPAETIAQSTSFNANQNFYLVDDPKRILDTLNSSQGQENIVVMMSRDPAKFKSALKIG